MVKILGVDLYDYNITTAVATFIDDIKTSSQKENKLVSATGVHGIVTAQRNADFKKILSSFHLNLPDGMPGVWIGKLKGAKQMERCPGPLFFETCLKETGKDAITHFFCGGKEGVADELKIAVSKKFNNNNIVGTFCPPFRELSEAEFRGLGKLINDSGANIIWIGLGTPKQERFAYRLREFTTANYIVTVGAAFDFHTDRLKIAPYWMQQSGLEWLFRLSMEPTRLYKRYFSIIPLFIYYNIRGVFKSN